MFALRLFGGLSLEGPSGPLSGRVSQRRRLALLALLAVQRNGGLTREKVVSYLWPETDEERARHRLSDSLYVIRKALGECALVTPGDEVRLNSEMVWADVREFEVALRRGERERGVELYAGPFLDGFHLCDAPEFDRWAETQRQRYAEDYATALESLAREAEQAGAARRAAEWWKKLAVQNPYSSRVAIGLMNALVAAGDRAGALHAARTHEKLLKSDVGLEPTAEVTALIEKIKDHS